MRKPWAILGSGPAGLLAALGAGLMGKPVAVFSNNEKSQLGGAQYLHRGVPVVTDPTPDAYITSRLVGDSDTYRKKVYGDMPVPFVSFDGVLESQPAWSLINAYDNLWAEFGHVLNEATVTPEWLERKLDEFEVVISTVPAPAICKNRAEHSFTVQEIYVSTDDTYCSVPRGEDNVVVYDGTPDRAHYRSSRLFGHAGTEWSSVGGKPPIDNLIKDRKPISTNCDCFEGRVFRAGRRGAWTKGVLAHHAFEKAVNLAKEHR